MLAVAAESIIKLVAFLAVGVFVTFVMFPGPVALFSRALAEPRTAAVLTNLPAGASFFATTVLSLFAIVLLPRQFHVAVVENEVGFGDMGVFVEMFDPPGIEARRPPFDPMDNVAFLQKKFSEISAILPGHAGN